MSPLNRPGFHVTDARQLVDRLLALLPRRKRVIVAVAGVPGAGKSTLVDTITTLLAQNEVCARLLPQDGFHYSRAQLAAFSDPEDAFRRRGAPFTFDASRFVAAVQSLRSGDLVAAPLFDHRAKDPVDGDIVIGSDVRMVFVEGNYVGLKEAPWDAIVPLCDEYWCVDTDPVVVRDQLVARHVATGVAASWDDAVARCDVLDADNAAYICAHLQPADVYVNLG